MEQMTIAATDIFCYLRGALRGSFGLEDFRDKTIFIFGMGTVGQQLLTMLCFSGPEIVFADESIVNYRAAHKICESIQVASSGDDVYADIIIDLRDNTLSIAQGPAFKTVNLSTLGKEPYTQGIHDFYL